MDDILVWGSTEFEHDERVRRVMEVVRKANLKFNKLQ